MIELILGGARSGKSRLAEETALNSGLKLIYIATAQALDEEMDQRIVHHQQRRGEQWQLFEEPLALAASLKRFAASDTCILVDCLTLWLTNCLLSEDSDTLADQRAQLLALIKQLPGHVIFVSNEVGQGVVPVDTLSRRFVDESGFLHQALAQQCDKVTFVTAGLAQVLKHTPNTGNTQ
jgi:adenosylcobinamide kinase/adenosylcobinamide-phosphate guanylyltransferase